MKGRVLSRFAVLCLAIVITGADIGSAQQVQPLEPEWLTKMYGEGWQNVQEGVLQRDTGGGQYETFGYGAEGLRWILQGYEQRRDLLVAQYAETPTKRLAEQIDQVKAEIARINGAMESSASIDNFDNAAMATCSPSFGGSADASPLAEGWGSEATASTYFHSDCGQLGDTSATAYAHAIEGTLESTRSQNHPRNGGSSLESQAHADANGSMGCESWAQGSVTSSELGISYQTPLRQSFACTYNASIYTLDSPAWSQTGPGNIGPLSLTGSGYGLIDDSYNSVSLGPSQAGISFIEDGDAMLQSQSKDTVSTYANATVIMLEFTGRTPLKADMINPGSLMGIAYRSGLIQWGIDLKIAAPADRSDGPDLIARSYVGTTSTNDPAQIHVATGIFKAGSYDDSYRWVWTESEPGSSTGTGQWWIKSSEDQWQAWGAGKAGIWRPIGHANSRLLIREGSGSTNRLALDLLEARVTLGTLP